MTRNDVADYMKEFRTAMTALKWSNGDIVAWGDVSSKV